MRAKPPKARVVSLREIASRLATRIVATTGDSDWELHKVDTGGSTEVASVEKHHLYLDRDARAYICSSYAPRSLSFWMDIDKMNEGTLERYIQYLYRSLTGLYLLPQDAHKVNLDDLPAKLSQ